MWSRHTGFAVSFLLSLLLSYAEIFFLLFFFSFITFHDNVQNPIHSSQSVEKSSFSLYLFLTPAHFNSSTAGKVAGLCFKNEDTNLRSLRVFFRHCLLAIFKPVFKTSHWPLLGKYMSLVCMSCYLIFSLWLSCCSMGRIISFN